MFSDKLIFLRVHEFISLNGFPFSRKNLVVIVMLIGINRGFPVPLPLPVCAGADNNHLMSLVDGVFNQLLLKIGHFQLSKSQNIAPMYNKILRS